MLTATVTKRLDIPGELGQWILIRKLPWRKLREASQVQQREAFAAVRALGKDGLDAVSDVTPDQIQAFKNNPSAQYDPGTLLRAAILQWSYSDKPTPEEIEDLDTDTADWLLHEVVALAKPPRDEVTAKND